MTVALVTHKLVDNRLSAPDGYRWLGVGESGEKIAEAYRGITDRTGDSIADLNSVFCELTAMYWLWKNCDDDIKGLVHYRRYFTNPSGFPLTMGDIEDKLDHSDLIVPKKYHLIATVEQHYASHHDVQDLECARSIVSELHPAFLDAFDACMKSHFVYPYNMIIAHREAFDAYCAWLFPILFELVQVRRREMRDSYQGRFIGFVSERLLGVYLLGSGSRYCENEVFLSELRLKQRVSMTLGRLFHGQESLSV